MIMYFLTDLESKLVLNKLLPQARKVGVSEDLRGWSWARSPMKPFHDNVQIPMYLACSKYCPTNRDVFLNKVKDIRGEITFPVSVGITTHQVVAHAFTEFLDGKERTFEEFWSENKDKVNYTGFDETGRKYIETCAVQVWDMTQMNCKLQVSNRSAEQYYASKRYVLSTAVPFLIEHRLSGKLLGLSGLLAIDCYDYMHSIIFDLKTMPSLSNIESWHKLYTTGYALVLESIYEIPVDIGGLILIYFKDGKLTMNRDLFFINDELRSWWLEERDAKLELIAERRDPGVAQKCMDNCIYWNECH